LVAAAWRPAEQSDVKRRERCAVEDIAAIEHKSRLDHQSLGNVSVNATIDRCRLAKC
jgi:hypothetical protein